MGFNSAFKRLILADISDGHIKKISFHENIIGGARIILRMLITDGWTKSFSNLFADL